MCNFALRGPNRDLFCSSVSPINGRSRLSTAIFQILCLSSTLRSLRTLETVEKSRPRTRERTNFRTKKGPSWGRIVCMLRMSSFTIFLLPFYQSKFLFSFVLVFSLSPNACWPMLSGWDSGSGRQYGKHWIGHVYAHPLHGNAFSSKNLASLPVSACSGKCPGPSENYGCCLVNQN